jgi:D-glycero-beta-D-manno-heptose-7-phosphate kinase
MTTSQTIQSLQNQRVMIVGDVMLDRYLSGQVSRISPEAPVPVVHHQTTEDRLGGAANVALNVAAMGSEAILCSIIGHDEAGHVLAGLLPRYGISAAGLVRSNQRCTTVKARVIAHNQQMLRIDYEQTHDLTPEEADVLLQRIRMLMDEAQPHALILQDYNKGVLSLPLIESVLALCHERGIAVAVDPKYRHFLAYRGVALFKPNLKEIREAVPFEVVPEVDSLQRASDYLRTHLGHAWTMITLSEHGIFLDAQALDSAAGAIFPTTPRSIADVSGAGDTVISVAALGLAAGLAPQLIARLSNLAGGQVCESPGVVPVDPVRLGVELEG